MMDMTLLLDQGGTVSSHSVTGAWIVVMPVMVERYAEIARVAIQFCPGAVPDRDAFAVSRGISRRAGERKIPAGGTAESAAECVPVPGRNRRVAATAHGAPRGGP
jgi:hypothetical protein